MQSAREFNWILKGILVGLSVLPSSFGARLSTGRPVEIYRMVGSQRVLIHRWHTDEWAKLPVQSVNEKSLKSGKSISGSGFLVGAWIQKATEALSAADRAEVDLVEFESSSQKVWVPWFLVNRFRVALVLGDGKNVPAGWTLVMPIKSQPLILAESLPLAAMEVDGVERVILSRYSDRAPGLKLDRRSDPVALRGEKLFQQGCVTCHGGGARQVLGQIAQMDRERWQKVHPSLPWPELQDREWRGLRSFAAQWVTQEKPAEPTKPKE